MKDSNLDEIIKKLSPGMCMDSRHEDWYERYNKAKQELQELITKREREARIDELKNITHDKRMFYKGIHIVPVSSLEDRLKELNISEGGE
jgi:ABC-type Fe3+-citrate transport system substrate-binding protein